MGKETSSISNGRADVLPLLKRELSKNGCLSKQVMSRVAEQTGLPLNEVYGISTFYTHLPVSKTGKNVIRVCESVPCDLKDAQAIIDSIRKELGIAPGEATADGKFSFELVSCIGACDQAPAMMVNDQLYGNLTPETVAEILKSY